MLMETVSWFVPDFEAIFLLRTQNPCNAIPLEVLNVLKVNKVSLFPCKKKRKKEKKARMDILCMNGNKARGKIEMSPTIRVVTTPEPQLQPHQSYNRDLTLCSF